jgi:D-glucosaminate-6-phosphate ammonia-lyase
LVAGRAGAINRAPTSVRLVGDRGMHDDFLNVHHRAPTDVGKSPTSLSGRYSILMKDGNDMDAYEELGVSRVINASGMMTALGGSTISARVGQEMAHAGQQQVVIEELQRQAGAEIARLLGTEDALVTTGAASGIALMVAALVAGSDMTRVEALPDPGDAPNEIIIQAGHVVNFGAPVRQMVAIGGGKARPIGSTNQVHEAHLSGAINANTAGVLFVQSHHCVQKGMLSLKRVVELCQERAVPVILDAAAEEDLRAFATCGVDLVTFSGGKAIGGPASGIIAGRADLIEACRAQLSGIGRPMKVGKEAIIGLVTALNDYVNRDLAALRARQREIVDDLLGAFAEIPGVQTRRLDDEAGRGIQRAAIELSPDRALELAHFLRSGTPPIYPREHLLNLGLVALDPRPLSRDDAEVIVSRVREFFAAAAQPSNA